MAARRKIGLIYKYDENWIGGTYYIQNLISSLHTLPEEQKPALVIIADKLKDFEGLVSNTGYPYMELSLFSTGYPFLKRLGNRISTMLTGRPLFGLFRNDIGLVFPAWVMRSYLYSPALLYWIPDFQEKHLPQFFSAEELRNRQTYQDEIVRYGKDIVFSSHSALADFERFYPANRLTKHVLQFAVTHSLTEQKDVREVYDIRSSYFICSNQFWKHKNHTVVFQAIALLKKAGINCTVVLTGKEHDDRNPTFFDELKDEIKTLGIEDRVRLLGFIPRNDQLMLMQQSLAVIQPSMFEGWSTVIEDAKALKVYVVASDLDVHREQLQEYSGKDIFGVHDPTALAAIIEKLIQHPPAATQYDYNRNVKDFANGFMKVVDQSLAGRR